MTTPTLRDDAARRTITTATDINLFVEAGAGSGKTHLLVQRLITLIAEEGVPVDRIAAITFTEKAAGELADRLRTALESIAATGVHDSGIAVREFADTDTARRNARAALEQLPAAAIETLHAFCLRIITLHPLEAGVPPTIRVASDFTSLLAADELAAGFLALCDETISGGIPDLTELPDCRVSGAQFAESLAALSTYGDWLTAVRDRIRWMDEHWGDLGPTIAAPLVRPEPIGARDVDDCIRRLRELLRNCANSEDKFAVTVATCLNNAEALLAHPDPAPEDLAPPSFSCGHGGRTADWEIPIRDARDRFRSIGEDWAARYAEVPAHHVAVVRHVMACHVVATAQRRINGGTLDYHDLIYVADRLLTAHPGRGGDIAADTRATVRGELHRRFTHLLIDEFQDTDPAQLRIIRAIAGDGGDPIPGHLFTVGDPKQSIYRFRRADIDSYLDARNTGRSELVELTTNFRSSAPVIDWVNGVFSTLFANARTTDGGQGNTVPFAALTARPGAPVEDCGVVVMNNHRDNEENLTPEDAENRDIVAAVRAALAGRWRHHPRGSRPGESAPFRLRDIAVLSVTHRAARATMAALRDAGIPCISENSSLVYQGTEIVDLHTVLRAIADPADEFTVAAALRTSLIGCSDGDLAQWRADGRRFLLPRAATACDGGSASPSPVAEGLGLLGALAEAATGRPVGRIVAAAVDALNMDAVAAELEDDPTPALHRIRTVRDNAHEYSREVGEDLRGYLEWSDTQAITSSRLAEPVIDTEDVDAVRVLTVHGAKGREFPMVILAGLSGRKHAHTADIGLNRATGTVAMRLSASCAELRTPDWETWSGTEKLASDAEWIRLLYVAATRAESVLLIPLEPTLTSSGKPRRDCAGYVLHELLDPGKVEFTDLADIGPAATAGAPALRRPDELERGTREVDAAVRSAVSRPGRAAVTRLAHGDPALTDLPDDYPAPAGNGAGFRLAGAPVSKDHGTAFGTAVHRVMERVTDPGEIGELAAGAARLSGLGDRETASVRAAAESFLSSPLIRRALAGEHHRELPVAGRVGSITVDGIIDLIYRDDDGWVILDYKTDAGLGADTAEEYFRQLGLYAHLIGDGLGAPVVRLELAVARKGQPEIITRHRGRPTRVTGTPAGQ
ncbi:UvrD-helicase domain-containing protein [Corynebacterium sp. CCM 8835]|uniref:DNA 3'-5' helicase n=1 Tax=Corynebacterium antarcticum TaxID=2800405 RepID=A0ABS1FNF1_9CORY|nr:UvrD-helicase domain-containing protein [Corynebacterium antarcticum]MCL0245242.1 UvrD-helicase domain-containing protein [Corynebacterium antarcticum]